MANWIKKFVNEKRKSLNAVWNASDSSDSEDSSSRVGIQEPSRGYRSHAEGETINFKSFNNRQPDHYDQGTSRNQFGRHQQHHMSTEYQDIANKELYKFQGKHLRTDNEFEKPPRVNRVRNQGHVKQGMHADSVVNVVSSAQHNKGRVHQPNRQRNTQLRSQTSNTNKTQKYANSTQHNSANEVVSFAVPYKLPSKNPNHQEGSRNESGCKTNSNYVPGMNKSKEGFSKNEQVRPMGFRKLEQLITKEPNEILLNLCSPTYGFQELLEQSEVKSSLVEFVLIALGKACKSSHRSNVTSLINKVTQNNSFMLISLTRYIVSSGLKFDQSFLDSLQYLVEFLQCFQLSQPASASEILSILIPLLKGTCQKHFQNDLKTLTEIMKKIDEMEIQKDYFIKHHTPQEIQHTTKTEQQQLLQPPENFRSLPVLPNDQDIKDHSPFLRPNVVNGKYSDVEHYLDVQFRLLREDYVRPLREGIAEYLKLKRLGKSIKSREIRIYQNVHIIKQDFSDGGIVHVVRFDVEQYGKINWEFSKRFLSGSLLCLSSDDFVTTFFASVAFRDSAKLKDGLLMIKFEKITDEIMNFSPLQSYIIIETEAYFEAYRHNLAALQEMKDDNLPLKKYIVDVHKTIDHPHYLRYDTTYDLRPLFTKLNDPGIIHKSNSDGEYVAEYEFSRNVSSNVRSVPILNLDQWPTAEELNLDQSQYESLRAAITKEFVVIQGPPGTGKTYIGLRIVQLLLHNVVKWNLTTKAQAPILIVCYTNHALDQFLEGVLPFTKNIVRVGGRGKNEALAVYQLNNMKKALRDNRNVPHHIFSNMKFKNFSLRSLKNDINTFQNEIEKSTKTILGEEILKDFMDEKHYISLKHFVAAAAVMDDGLAIYDWLEIRFRGFQPFENFKDDDVTKVAQNTLKASNKNLNKTQPTRALVYQTVPQKGQNSGIDIKAIASGIKLQDDEEFEKEEEADVEYIEAMRGIDAEEFSGIDFNLENTEMDDEFLIESEGGWQVQGGNKQMKRYIANRVQETDSMTENEVNNILNIWGLNINDRWRLYRYWLECFIKAKQNDCIEMQQHLRQEFQELTEMRTEEDMYVLRKADVVGMTTTGAAKYRNIVQNLNPRIIIVEEAAEILESHIVTSLAQDTQHLILIGDHQQLRPSPTVHDLAVKFNLNVSLFERMVKNGMECHKLSIQHRMRPSIAALLVPHIYSNLENHQSVQNFENIKGVSKNCFFLTHNYLEGQEFDSKSRVNRHEAEFIIKFCRHLLLQGYTAGQITILTTYSGQLFALRKLATDELLKGVRITVVDNFQGEENDIILVSFVRSNDEGVIGFLKISNRVCVALSRARKGLFCIGNFQLLAEKSDLWKNILSTLNEQNAVGPSIQLACQNHPNIVTNVATGKDFNQVPEGGCTQLCEYRLLCGHTCTRMCHPYDALHEKVQCMKNCVKVLCENNHKCQKKCFQKCGNCMIPVIKVLPQCQHTVSVPCSIQVSDFQCTESCPKILSCGHKCIKRCTESCVDEGLCKARVRVNLPCGHNTLVNCCDAKYPKLSDCKENCKAELQCGHICSGTCGKCYQGRIHQTCKNPCKRILVCGHECTAPCSKNCPPCKRKCNNRCIHSKCPYECGSPCDMCNESCMWSCNHTTCRKLCSELCDRAPCNEPCEKKLKKCGHQCIGLCGEPCPKLCAICNKGKVQEIFFGNEDEIGARFITLEDCNHIFEVEGLTRWMNVEQSKEGESQIQMKNCPKCKTVIRRNLRFGNIIKFCLADIEKVKKIVFGDVASNARKQSDLENYFLETARDLANLVNVCSPVLDILSGNKKLSHLEIIRCENVINIAVEFLKATSTSPSQSFLIGDIFQSQYFDGCELHNFFIHVDELRNFANDTYKFVKTFIYTRCLNAADQQLQELHWEVHRLNLVHTFFQFLKKNATARTLTSSCAEYIIRIVECLGRYAPFNKQHETEFNDAFKRLTHILGSAVINVTKEEKKVILKAMNLTQGHWYQCPNGHVYCITECGGAMQESRCNECGATIGGASHALRSDNRVATDMDGSHHPAWSQINDMRNFQF